MENEKLEIMTHIATGKVYFPLDIKVSTDMVSSITYDFNRKIRSCDDRNIEICGAVGRGRAWGSIQILAYPRSRPGFGEGGPCNSGGSKGVTFSCGGAAGINPKMWR